MQPLRHFWRSLRVAPGFTHGIMAVTLAIWIVKATWLDFVPAPNHVLVGLGHVVDGLLSAIIAGYVFFIVFAIYPEYRQRRVIARFLYGRVARIAGDCKGVIDKIEAASKCGIPFWTATEKDVERAFAATATATPPPGIINDNGSPMTWPGFFMFRYGRTVVAIDELFQQARYLDPELASLLTDIRDAPFYKMTAAAVGTPLSNPDLSAWAPGFYKYLKDCRQLIKWHDGNRVEGVVPPIRSSFT